MIKVVNNNNAMTNPKIRNHPIFKTPLKINNHKDTGAYSGEQKIYVGDLAKKVLRLSLIDGLVGPKINKELSLNDERGFIIGNTLVAHRIRPDQTGVLKGVENAEQLLNEYIDFVEVLGPILI